MSKIIYKNKQWHFTEKEVRTNDLSYFIERSEIDDADWIDHLAGKRWCNIIETIDIVIRARHYYEYGRLPKNLTVPKDYLYPFIISSYEKKPN